MHAAHADVDLGLLPALRAQVQEHGVASRAERGVDGGGALQHRLPVGVHQALEAEDADVERRGEVLSCGVQRQHGIVAEGAEVAAMDKHLRGVEHARGFRDFREEIDWRRRGGHRVFPRSSSADTMRAMPPHAATASSSQSTRRGARDELTGASLVSIGTKPGTPLARRCRRTSTK